MSAAVSKLDAKCTSATVLAPFALVRLAGLPLCRLDSMAVPRTAQLVTSAVASRLRLPALQLSSEEHLHELVPELKDRMLRRAALQLRRDIHNGDLPRLPSLDLEPLLDRLNEDARDAVRACLETMNWTAHLLQLGQFTLEDETQSMLRPGFWSATKDPRLRLGIAAASPEFSSRIALEKDRPANTPEATKLELSLLRYLLRAACKTSPFSTFMDVGAVPVGRDLVGDGISLTQARVVRSVHLNRGIPVRLYAATKRSWAGNDSGIFQPNPTLRSDSRDRLTALVGEQVALLGSPWHQERVSRFRIHRNLKRILVHLPPSFQMCWLLREFGHCGLTQQQARHFAAKAIERELIWPTAVLDAFVPEPLEGIASAVPGAAKSVSQVLCFDWVDELTKTFSGARNSSIEDRSELDRKIRQLEKRTLQQLGFGTYEAYRNVIFDESRIQGVRGSLHGGIHDLICEVGEFLRDQVALRPEFVQLRNAFCQRYGTSGRCTDVVSFLSHESGALWNVPEWHQDMKPSVVEADIPAEAGSRIGLTAFVQSAGDIATENPNELLIIVNRVYEGVGWLSARHSAGDGSESSKLRNWISQWLENVYSPAEPVDFPVSGHCNDLQAHPRLTRRILAWPTEPLRPDRQQILYASDLMVRLNSNTGFFEFYDDRAALIAPVYLGSVLPAPTWGPVFGLTVMAQPLHLLRPPVATPVAENSQITFYPRQVQGRIVLTRASWSVRTDYLRHAFLEARGFLRLVRFVEFCERMHVPRMFFALAERWIDPLRSDSSINARKPIFIDGSNPFCLDLLDRLARDSETLVLTEVLPAHQHAWQMPNGESRVTEFQVEMLVSALGPSDPTLGSV